MEASDNSCQLQRNGRWLQPRLRQVTAVADTPTVPASLDCATPTQASALVNKGR